MKLFNLLRNVLTSKCPRAAAARQARIGLQRLDDRLNPTAVVSNGDLYIHGTNWSDTVTVTVYTPYERSSTAGTGGYYVVTENGYSRSFAAANVYGGNVRFYGNDGNDSFSNATGLRAVAYGGDGDDTLSGGSSDDFLDGGAGFDILSGHQGNDVLVGGYDYRPNYLYGGDGDDSLYGADGPDRLYGGDGSDFLHGRDGADYLYGQNGDDTLIGGVDGYTDHLYGGDGRDKFSQEVLFAYGLLWYRDDLADFTPGEDSMYHV